jgi:hypothetical protein
LWSYLFTTGGYAGTTGRVASTLETRKIPCVTLVQSDALWAALEGLHGQNGVESREPGAPVEG